MVWRRSPAGRSSRSFASLERVVTTGAPGVIQSETMVALRRARIGPPGMNDVGAADRRLGAIWNQIQAWLLDLDQLRQNLTAAPSR